MLNSYEELLVEADSKGLITREKPLLCNDGRIKGNKIAIRQDIKTTKEKACVLAEELGHYYTTVGNILDQTDAANRKQELQARMIAYNKMIGLQGIIHCYKKGCHNLYEMAQELNVTEEFLNEALIAYEAKYGESVILDNYLIQFTPYLGVMERFD